MNKSRIILAMAFVLMTVMSYGQDKIFPVAQEMPILKGCDESMDLDERNKCTQNKIKALLAENLKYPEEAKKANQEGYAIVSFVVSSKGGIDDLQLKEDPGYGMGEAAMKAVKKMNKEWIAGMNKGVPVNVRMSIPVSFKLPKEEKEEAEKAPEVYTVVDEMPAFAGCGEMKGQEAQSCTFEKLTRHIMDNMKYPEEAKEAGTEGTVITEFIIDESGNVTKVVVTQGLGKGCDQEALRLLSEMPAWTAGKHQGKAVKVQMTLPFRFRMRKG